MDQLNLQFKIQSQYGLILKEMENFPHTWFTVGHFCGVVDHCFVGYKSSARICELQKKGFLISRWSIKTTALGTKLKEYKLSPRYMLDYEGDKIKILERPTDQSIQSNLF